MMAGEEPMSESNPLKSKVPLKGGNIMQGERCSATANRTGKRCQNKPVRGLKVCRIHGGASPRGIAAGGFKHGMYSKYLPPRLLSRFAESVGDPELIALTQEAAVAATRIGELLSELDREGASDLWSQARKALAEFEASINDVAKAREALTDLKAILGRGAAMVGKWTELQSWLETRGRIVEKEARRQKDLQMMMTVEQAGVLIGAVAESVKRHVTDRKALVAISADLGKLLCGDAA